GVVREHKLDGCRVVEVDPISQLLRAVVFGDGQGSEADDIALERLAVGRCHLAIANAIYLALNQVFLQECRPFPMINLGRRGRIGGSPAWPEILARSQQALDRAKACKGKDENEDCDDPRSRPRGSFHPTAFVVARDCLTAARVIPSRGTLPSLATTFVMRAVTDNSKARDAQGLGGDCSA